MNCIALDESSIKTLLILSSYDVLRLLEYYI